MVSKKTPNTADVEKAEQKVWTIMSGIDGVRWVKVLPQNGSQKIVVATSHNTVSIRQRIRKRFPRRINRTPTIDGLVIIAEYLPGK